jgi:HEPN domain-containing protein
VKDLIRQAEEDFKTADLNIGIKRYYASVFFAQQSAEKILKALYIHKLKELPMTHNLVELAKDLNAQEKIMEAARELNPEYLTTRYVDAANGVPADMYSRQSAKIHLEAADVILKWAMKYLI